MAAEIWKIEYHGIDEAGDAIEWGDSLESVKNEDGVVKVEKVIYYLEDHTTVWPKDQADGD